MRKEYYENMQLRSHAPDSKQCNKNKYKIKFIFYIFITLIKSRICNLSYADFYDKKILINYLNNI
jgi:hypothetical protein